MPISQRIQASAVTKKTGQVPVTFLQSTTRSLDGCFVANWRPRLDDTGRSARDLRFIGSDAARPREDHFPSDREEHIASKHAFNCICSTIFTMIRGSAVTFLPVANKSLPPPLWGRNPVIILLV